MKNNQLTKIAVIIALFLVTGFTANAQNAGSSSDDTRPAQNVYFELFGPGLTYSFNYDTRFTQRRDGIGMRIGVSYYADQNNNHDRIFTLPFAFNYLLGKRGKYFEIGAGATYYSTNTNYLFLDHNDEHQQKSGVIGTLNFGFRLQPVDGGFSFRTGFSPVINDRTFMPYWPYVSFGYSF